MYLFFPLSIQSSQTERMISLLHKITLLSLEFPRCCLMVPQVYRSP